MIKIFKTAIFVIFYFVFTSCATIEPEIASFNRIRIGNEKNDVLELLGSPKRDEHRKGRDWWYYQFYYSGKKYNRMIVFEKNKVIYAGRVTVPKYEKDVETVDKANENSNKGLELLPPSGEE